MTNALTLENVSPQLLKVVGRAQQEPEVRRPRFSWTHISEEYDVEGGRNEQEESEQRGCAGAHAGSP